MSREHKLRTINLGEAAGEEFAASVFADGGIDALAKTLKPRPYEGYAQAFYELWEGGDEAWMQRAQERAIGVAKGAHPYYLKAFDEVFARGARRWAEMLVRGYLDARAGVPFDMPDGRTVQELEQRLTLMRRRHTLGPRPALIAAYETGHKLWAKQPKKEG